MFIIVATEILLSALCVRSRRAAKLVSGSPRVIIRNGVIDQATLFDLRFTVDDLLEAPRTRTYLSFQMSLSPLWKPMEA